MGGQRGDHCPWHPGQSDSIRWHDGRWRAQWTLTARAGETEGRTAAAGAQTAVEYEARHPMASNKYVRNVDRAEGGTHPRKRERRGVSAGWGAGTEAVDAITDAVSGGQKESGLKGMKGKLVDERSKAHSLNN